MGLLYLYLLRQILKDLFLELEELLEREKVFFFSTKLQTSIPTQE